MGIKTGSSKGKERRRRSTETKTAQQIAKDMERWARSSTNKENFKIVSSLSAPCEMTREAGVGHCGDAGYAIPPRRRSTSRETALPAWISRNWPVMRSPKALERLVAAQQQGRVTVRSRSVGPRKQGEAHRLAEAGLLLLCRRHSSQH